MFRGSVKGIDFPLHSPVSPSLPLPCVTVYHHISTGPYINKLLNMANVKKKIGKAVSLQSWSGPEGSRKLRFPAYMTTAQDGGKVVSLTHRPPLPTGNAPGTHFR
jgi:hypothetical protein